MNKLVVLSACTILAASGLSLAQNDHAAGKAATEKGHCEQMMQGMMGKDDQGMMGKGQQGMMGKDHQGMMGKGQQGMMGKDHRGMNDMHKECMEMMGRQGKGGEGMAQGAAPKGSGTVRGEGASAGK